MAKQAVNVYADAFFTLAVEADKLEERRNEVLFLQEVLRENPEYLKFQTSPRILNREKEEVTKNSFESQISKDFMGLLTVLIRKGRIGLLEDILECFIEKEKEYHKVGNGSVASAVALTEEQKLRMEKKLLEMTGYRKINFQYFVDENLIGGWSIQIGDQIVDNSIRGKLKQMAENLIRT